MYLRKLVTCTLTTPHGISEGDQGPGSRDRTAPETTILFCFYKLCFLKFYTKVISDSTCLSLSDLLYLA